VDCSQICRCSNLKKTEGLPTRNAKPLNLKVNLIGVFTGDPLSPRRMEFASEIALFSSVWR
jgi:hypothetical protein